MKKYHLYLWIIALVGLMTSCSQDETDALQTATESNRVTLTASLPEDFAQIGTRALPAAPADHKLRCILEVWTQGESPALKHREEQVGLTGDNVVFDFTIDEGTYDCLFWADFIGKDANGFHFSMKDAMSLNMDGGDVIINGPQGITGTPNDSTFTIGVILVLITLVIVLHLIHSRDGRAIMSIRDNRIAAESVGINITKYKLMAFIISAALAGVAGVLYAHNLATLTALPKNFGYNQSIMILVFVVLGGIGSTRGSMIAAVVLTLLPELLRGLNDYRMLIYAIVLIVMMLLNWSPKALEMRERYSPKRLLAKRKEAKEAK